MSYCFSISLVSKKENQQNMLYLISIQTCQLPCIWHETHAFYKSYTESHTKLKIPCIFHKKLTMSLKIAKFMNKHLKNTYKNTIMT